MKPEELSDAIIEFQSKHAVSDTTLAFASHLSVEKVHAMKQGRGNFTSDEINQTIVKINDISMQTARAMDEAAQAVTDLTRQAKALSDLIAEMKRG